MRSLASALRGLFFGRGKEEEGGDGEAEIQEEDDARDDDGGREAEEEREVEERDRERVIAAAAIEEEMRAAEREAEEAEERGSEKELKAELGEAQLGTLRFSSLSRSRPKGACGCWQSLSPSVFASCDEAATAAAVERAMGVCGRCAAKKKNETDQAREKQPQFSDELPDTEGGGSLGSQGEAEMETEEEEEEEWQTQLWLMQESEALRFRLVLSLTRPRQMAVAERHFLGVARPLDPLSTYAVELRGRTARGDDGVSAEEQQRLQCCCCCYILEVRNVREEAYVGSSTSRSATASGLEDLKLAAVIESSSPGVGLDRSARRVRLLLLNNDSDGDASRKARLLPSRCLPLALERTADADVEP
jgi:hypothetical protein